MNIKEWQVNINQRDDLSSYLIHFTKPEHNLIGEFDSAYILSKILSDKELKGSTTERGFIHGDTKAVCLHDIPIQNIAKSIYGHSNSLDKNKMINFTGVGLCFSKRFVYKNGGRPVIYDKPNIAKKYLDKNEWWRIVNLDLDNDKNIVDWTHEREWRVPNNLKFNLSDVTIIVTNYEVYQHLLYYCKSLKLDIVNNTKGIFDIKSLKYICN